MTARYRSREKMRVTLTLMPSAMTAVIAGRPARVAGILISTLGRSTILCSSIGLVDGGLGLVGQPGVHLDGHPAVDVSGGLEDAGEQVAGVPDVVGGDLADGVVHGGAAGGQLVELFLVGRAVLQCGLEDRWVGGDPADVPGVNQVLEVPGVQALTGEVIEPQGHPLRGQSGKSVSHWCSPLGVRFP